MADPMEKVPHSELSWLLMTCVRYSLGRMSYAPGLTSEIVLKHQAAFSTHERKNVAEDIRRHLASNPGEAADLRATWTKLAEELEKK